MREKICFFLLPSENRRRKFVQLIEGTFVSKEEEEICFFFFEEHKKKKNSLKGVIFFSQENNKSKYFFFSSFSSSSQNNGNLRNIFLFFFLEKNVADFFCNLPSSLMELKEIFLEFFFSRIEEEEKKDAFYCLSTSLRGSSKIAK